MIQTVSLLYYQCQINTYISHYLLKVKILIFETGHKRAVSIYPLEARPRSFWVFLFGRIRSLEDELQSKDEQHRSDNNSILQKTCRSQQQDDLIRRLQKKLLLISKVLYFVAMQTFSDFISHRCSANIFLVLLLKS